ncbi:unnamed protein product [Dibothriocephalus latus]|uniref:4Fe-4S ferredoxin-type domain-containing protein n=1 Tax=Dibothriocephalus latus TaxID=60516 RepID=A0A3P7P2Q0_DIBLA|nr:unnamed protein product [Dibothriocephalus latus]
MSQSQTQNTLTRIAIVNQDKCKPKKCRQQCQKSCSACIEVTPSDKIAFISVEFYIGCGICLRKCPFQAINIINLPGNWETQVTHHCGSNSFKLHRLPIPRPGQVLGIVGTNGIGNATALKVLARFQNYFTEILEDNLKAFIKPPYVDQIPKAIWGARKDDHGRRENLNFKTLVNRDVIELSRGELQRFAVAMVCIQKADIYMFEEPSSYLDFKKRLKMYAFE